LVFLNALDLARLFRIRFSNRNVGILRRINRVLHWWRRWFRWDAETVLEGDTILGLHEAKMPDVAVLFAGDLL
jgi:hypothetical protein